MGVSMPKDKTLWEKTYALHQEHKARDVKGPRKTKPKQKKAVRQPFIPHDAAALKERLSEVNAQIRTLNAERRKLKEELRAPWRAGYDKKPWAIYVLRLQNDCWYIGISKNVDKRYAKHIKGKGAVWTKQHRPIAIHEIRTTTLTLESDAGLLEDQVTLEYARQFGTEKVRGGGYCQQKPRWPEELYEPDLSWVA